MTLTVTPLDATLGAVVTDGSHLEEDPAGRDDGLNFALARSSP